MERSNRIPCKLLRDQSFAWGWGKGRGFLEITWFSVGVGEDQSLLTEHKVGSVEN